MFSFVLMTWQKEVGRATLGHDQDAQLQAQRVMDMKIKEMKDQLIRAKAYLSFAVPAGNTHLIKELRLRVKELERAMGQAGKDSDLSRRLLFIHLSCFVCIDYFGI